MKHEHPFDPVDILARLDWTGVSWGQDRLSAFLGIKWQKVKPDTEVTPMSSNPEIIWEGQWGLSSDYCR
jgi:hypothetical protein